MKRHTRTALATVLACASLPAAAADDDAWHGSVGFDAWLFVLDGTATLRGREVNVNTSFKDTFDLLGHIDSILAGSGEFGKGRYRFVGDFMHLDFGIPEDRGDVDLKIQQAGGVLAYRTQGDATGADGYFDVLAGVRWFNVELGFDSDGPLGLEVSGEEDTVHAVLGFRGDNKITDHIHLNYRADVGGFQRDDNSLLLYGGMTYKFENNFYFNAGVKVLSLKFDEERSGTDRFSHRLRYYGPQFGGGWSF